MFMEDQFRKKDKNFITFNFVEVKGANGSTFVTRFELLNNVLARLLYDTAASPSSSPIRFLAIATEEKAIIINQNENGEWKKLPLSNILLLTQNIIKMYTRNERKKERTLFKFQGYNHEYELLLSIRKHTMSIHSHLILYTLSLEGYSFSLTDSKCTYRRLSLAQPSSTQLTRPFSDYEYIFLFYRFHFLTFSQLTPWSLTPPPAISICPPFELNHP